MSRWALLADRERTRMFYSAMKQPQSSEELFYSVKSSRKHRKLNRYADIFAYDRTAVTVGEEYLNANVVKDGYGGWWVAAQAPLPETIPAFISAIKSHAASGHPLIGANTRGAIIVQLTGYEERGIRKADPYLDHFQHVSTAQMPKIGSTLTEMRADGVDVSHYHFTAWPDHGVPVPADRPALKALVIEVGRRQREEQKEVWVHCSAGVGRSGAFITLSSLLLRTGTYQPPEHSSPLRPLKLPLSDVVAHTIDGLREYRGMLVQMEQQMELVDDMYRQHTS